MQGYHGGDLDLRVLAQEAKCRDLWHEVVVAVAVLVAVAVWMFPVNSGNS